MGGSSSELDKTRFVFVAMISFNCRFRLVSRDRRTYQWETNELRTTEDEQARRTEINQTNVRNVRPRLILEGPIRPPLRHEDLEYHYEERSVEGTGSLEGSESDDESVSTVRHVINLTEEDEQASNEGILVVEAMDPGIFIATAIESVSQGNR